MRVDATGQAAPLTQVTATGPWCVVVRGAHPAARPGVEGRESARLGAGEGAAYGLLTRGEAAELLESLKIADVPPTNAPDVPWAAVVHRRDGTVVAACSPMLRSGVFVATAPDAAPGWVVGLSAREVIQQSWWPHAVDAAWLAAFHRGDASEDGSPYRDIIRVPPGSNVTLRPQETTARTWCGTAVWDAEADVSGPLVAQQYLEIFDSVVADLARRSGPLAVAMSGGLDSTFVAASLVRAPRDKPVTAYIAVPLAGATAPQSVTVFDDEPWARTMTQAYPGLIDIEPVRNVDLIQPLDAAAALSARSWWPTFAVANLVWNQQINTLAAARGATSLFVGVTGNASFSASHPYAARYHAERREWGQLRRIARPGDARLRDTPRLVRGRIIAPLRGRPSGAAMSSREGFLRWLGSSSPNQGAAPPSATAMLRIDPFASRALLDFAARMAPVEWQRSRLPRGFARALGEGRVPDQIRLRRAHGAQAADAWHWIHGHRDRYFDESAALSTAPYAAEAIEVHRIQGFVRSWDWGNPTAPPPKIELALVDRALAFARFCRDTQVRLQELNHHWT